MNYKKPFTITLYIIITCTEICHSLKRSKESSGPTHLLPDLQRPLAQRFGLLVFAPFAVEHCQVVEGGSHCRVVLPQGLLSDSQSVVQQVSCFFVLILVPVKQSRK